MRLFVKDKGISKTKQKIIKIGQELPQQRPQFLIYFYFLIICVLRLFLFYIIVRIWKIK